MNSQQRVAQLEALLNRVHARAAEPRPARIAAKSMAKVSSPAPVVAAVLSSEVQAAAKPKLDAPSAPPSALAARVTPKAFDAPRPSSKPDLAPLRVSSSPKVEVPAPAVAIEASGEPTPPSKAFPLVPPLRDELPTLTERDRAGVTSAVISEHDEVTMIQPSIAAHLLAKASGGPAADREGEPPRVEIAPAILAEQALVPPADVAESPRVAAEAPAKASPSPAATKPREEMARAAVSPPTPAYRSNAPSDADQAQWTVTILSLAILAAGIVTYLLMR